MSRALKVTAVSGGLQRPSRTLALVEAILGELNAALPIDAQVIELGAIVPGLASTTARTALPVEVFSQIEAIESSDLLIVASPVYRASYTGLFKHLFDFVRQEALADVPVLLAATGGSDRHALVIEHQLRPLFGFFQALTLPIGVYATESDFTDYRVSGAELDARIKLAVERALPYLQHRQPADSYQAASV